MRYRKQGNVDKYVLCDVFYQSALAIATAHQQGIFHGGIMPANMLYNGHTLKLINFDTSIKWDCESLINKYRSSLATKLLGATKAYCPPEVQFYKSVKGAHAILPGKIDAYCWGMSMLQFLTGISDTELENLAYKMKNNFVDCSTILKKIQIPELAEKGGLCVMRLITRCLEYSPYSRLNMEDVLICLACDNEKFSGIFNSVSDKMKYVYSKKIGLLIAQSKMRARKIKQTNNLKLKKLQQINLNMVNLFDPLLIPAFNNINNVLERKAIYSNSLFKQIVESKSQKMELSEKKIGLCSCCNRIDAKLYNY
eukprot:TRINITY_DN1318_c0_g2_i2.p1 TRINITY_DN1318_c0_g2~~TRINITY_DN1318_c0_g2_i2.p1  ORF type:complete len:329 (-),score=23.46 TRINITY_DN1318_c0_g2_i2:232-1161(-)